MTNERGASLLEITLILFILSAIGGLLIVDYQASIDRMTLEEFSQQLQRDFNWALHYADTNQYNLLIEFLSGSRRYNLRSPQESNKVHIRRNYPKGIEITTNYGNSSGYFDAIRLYANGTVHRAGTIAINDKNTGKQILLIVQLDTGSIREAEG